MKKQHIQIRSSSFETNSSSSHSLVVDNSIDSPLALDKLINVYKANHNLKIPIVLGESGTTEFGWGKEVVNDLPSKINYLIADAMNPEHMFERIQRLLQKKAGIAIQCPHWQKYLDSLYIDHQSVGTTHSSLHSDFDLLNFLLNHRCGIIVSNDNE